MLASGDQARHGKRLHWWVVGVLLFVSVPLLSLLVFEQGRVIGAQRVLIQQLFQDSLELNQAKMREHERRQQATSETPQQAPEPPAAEPGGEQNGRGGAKPESKRKQDEISKPVPPPQPRRGWQMDRTGRLAI